MKPCSKVFERLWRANPLNEYIRPARRYLYGSVRRDFGVGFADRTRNPRRFEQLIGRSPALEVVLEQVERVAPTDSTVLFRERLAPARS